MRFRDFSFAVAFVIASGLFNCSPLTSQDTGVSTQQATIQITAPESAEVGHLIVLDTNGSKAKSFKWILPEGAMIIDDGRRVVFATPKEGVYEFILAGALDNSVDIATHKVTVGKGSFKIKLIRLAKNVKSDTLKEDALKLAQSFSSVALTINKDLPPSEIVAATFRSNQDALGTKLENWLPFREGLSKELQILADEGVLTTSESHIRVWREIADALREFVEGV